ncbi:MAG: hypothetical protein F6K18_20635 [Okeania sp. SIO2C2]|uniref:hypothetical protein n=1 Tax=Okeania sp. SIO2C2 TaxID=2607787 RepID=UPI0013BD5837|nr:hypothetical protein [Okeania sp. SIO2C2]NEP89042.1 hypothetical protein [Okeania sp. SIO2C2]
MGRWGDGEMGRWRPTPNPPRREIWGDLYSTRIHLMMSGVTEILGLYAGLSKGIIAEVIPITINFAISWTFYF